MNERIAKFAFLVPLLSLAFLPMGCKKPPPITLSCNASAPAIYPGDPLSVTAAAGSVNPKKNTNVLYSWSGTGVTGIGNAATVATGSLDPGSYTAKAEVKEGKKGKEGLKPGESAQCEANYTVKAFEAPTISCSSSPRSRCRRCAAAPSRPMRSRAPITWRSRPRFRPWTRPGCRDSTY